MNLYPIKDWHGFLFIIKRKKRNLSEKEKNTHNVWN